MSDVTEPKCEVCGNPMPGARVGKTTCSGKCRVKKARAGKVVQTAVPKKVAGGAAHKTTLVIHGNRAGKSAGRKARLQEAREMADFAAGRIDSAGQKLPACFTTFVGGGGYPAEREKAEATFVKGEKYRVTGGSMSQSSCWITLEGFEGRWNTAHFDIDIHACPLIENPYVRPPDVNAGARGAILARVPAVKSLEAPIAQVDNSAARAVAQKAPRKPEEPVPVVVSASSILGRMTSKLPSAPVVVPRGTPIEKP